MKERGLPKCYPLVSRPTLSSVPPPQINKASFPLCNGCCDGSEISLDIETGGFTTWLIGVADDSYYMLRVKRGGSAEESREKR